MLAEVCYDPQTQRGCPLKLQAALKLTFYQIHEILCAERDTDGKLIVEQSQQTDELTAEERFTNTWLRRCLPRWRIAKMWQEKLATPVEVPDGEHD